jgi:superoxide dismutase, Fe-Mn family
MFGPGYVWLAKSIEQEGRLHIFCTYNAGSPYPAAHARRQPVDMNTQPNDGHSDVKDSLYVGGTRNHMLRSTAAPGSLQVSPILCVNTWEHVWMMDYGIRGKDEFLNRWWDRINWEVVYDNYNLLRADAVSGSLDGKSPQRTVITV